MKYDDKFIYPFAEHKIFSAWIQDMIERHRTLSQANSCMHQNPYLRHSSVQELATQIPNNVSVAYVQHIYKYTRRAKSEAELESSM